MCVCVCVGGGGLELRTRCLLPGRAYQVVHKSQVLAFEVVGAFLIIRALASRLNEKLQCIITSAYLLNYQTINFDTPSVQQNKDIHTGLELFEGE